MPVVNFVNIIGKAEVHVQKSFVCKKFVLLMQCRFRRNNRDKKGGILWHRINYLYQGLFTVIYLFLHFISPTCYGAFVLSSIAAGGMQTPT